eukprot:6202208-Pleurochrysis_carterae.AAC.1
MNLVLGYCNLGFPHLAKFLSCGQIGTITSYSAERPGKILVDRILDNKASTRCANGRMQLLGRLGVCAVLIRLLSSEQRTLASRHHEDFTCSQLRIVPCAQR